MLISKTERLKARQTYDQIRIQATTYPVLEPSLPTEEELVALTADITADTLPQEFQSKATEHSPAARLVTARQLLKIREEKDPKPKPKPSELSERTLRVGPNGRILQCNEGKYDFRFIYTPDLIQLEIQLSKFLDTSLIDVDVQETYLRVLIKGKLLQLCLEEKVDPSRVEAYRNQSTGALVLYLAKPHAPLDPELKSQFLAWQRTSYAAHANAPVVTKKYAFPEDPVESVADSLHSEQESKSQIPPEIDEDWVDDPEVPPLV